MTATRARTSTRYAVINADGRYLARNETTTLNPREALFGYTRGYADNLARLHPGYLPVPISIGDYRCRDCNGYGEWQIGPDDWDWCHRCDGLGWIPSRKRALA